MYLPRSTPAADTVAPTRGRSASSPNGSETILVVEDNPDVRRLVRRQLTELGYSGHEAGNGPEALTLLRSPLAIDLMFTDIIMPEGMTGYELAGLAREFRPGMKILFTSGYTAIGAAQDQERRDVPLLSKPYRKSELAHFVRIALDEGAEGARLESA
jgi:CheY-like chemotaxis protein